MKEYLVSEAIFIDYSGSPVPTGELPLKLSLERPWARLSTGLSLATSLALAACGGTPGPSSKEAQPQASSSVPGVASKQLPPERLGSLRSFSSAILEQTEIPAEWVVQSLDLSAYGRPGVFTDTFRDNNRGFIINIAKEPLPSQAVNNPSVYVNGVVEVARKVFESAGQTPTSPLLWRGAIDGQDVWKFDSAGALTSALGQKYYDSRMALVKGGSGFVIGIQTTDTVVKDAREFGDLRSTVYGRFLGPLKFKSQPIPDVKSPAPASTIAPVAPTKPVVKEAQPTSPQLSRPGSTERPSQPNFVRLTSTNLPYSIEHPNNWVAPDPNKKVPAGTPDIFSSKERVNPGEPLTIVYVYNYAINKTLEENKNDFLQQMEQASQNNPKNRTKFTNPRFTPEAVKGRAAWQIDVDTTANPTQPNIPDIFYRYVVFNAEHPDIKKLNTKWEIMLAVVAGKQTDHRAQINESVEIFNKMLASFEPLTR